MEVERAVAIMRAGDYAKVVESPYLASAFYYSSAYLARVRSRKNLTPNERIFAEIGQLITSEARRKFADFLTSEVQKKGTGSRIETLPLPISDIHFDDGPNHTDALDPF